MRVHPKKSRKNQRPAPVREYTSEHANLFLGNLYQQGRNNFSVFRRIIRPNMLWGWWTERSHQVLLQPAEKNLSRTGAPAGCPHKRPRANGLLESPAIRSPL